MKRLLPFLFLFISFQSLTQDRILKDMGWEKQGTAGKVKILDKYLIRIDDSTYVNPKWAYEKFKNAYRAAVKIEYYKGQIYGLHGQCKSLIFLNEFDSSLYYAKFALRVADKSKDPSLQIQSHNVLAGVLSYMSEYDKAAEEYYLTYKLAKKHDELKAIVACANLGHVFNMVGNYVKSREYSERAYKQAVENQDTSIALMTLNLIGLADYHEHKFKDAIRHYKEALPLAQSYGDIQRESQIYFNLSNVYMELKDYDKALDYYLKAIEITKSSESYFSVATNFLALADIYVSSGKLLEAAPIIDSSMRYVRLSEDAGLIPIAYRLKAQYLNKIGKHALAYSYLDSAYTQKDSSLHLQLNQSILNYEEEFDKQQQALKDSLDEVQRQLKADHDRNINDQKIRSREILLWISGIALILVIFVLSRLYRNNRLIRTQKEEIQEQHREIKDSIQYALRIQEATLPKLRDFDRISNDNFVLFSPKDVVSGDFYWMHLHEQGGLKIWAVADCTGHGVPGGFMSMLGIGLLNEIVVESGKTDPGKILNELRDKILTALKQNNENAARDGMDVALCAWDSSSGLLHFAGANNALWIIPHGEFSTPEVPHKLFPHPNGKTLIEIAPDKMPIGYQAQNPPPFNTRTIHVAPGDSIILFSDGFADQFGGVDNKKFRYQPIRNILLENEDKSLEQAGKKLSEAFLSWKGKQEQTDDVCVVGIRLS